MNRYKFILLLFLAGLLIFSISRLGIYVMYYDKFSSYTTYDIIKVFVGAIRFDASILMTIICPIILLLLPPISNKIYSKILLWILFIVYLAVAFFLLSDVIYYGYVNRHITNELTLMGNDMSFMLDFAKLYIPQILIAVIVIAFLSVLYRKVAGVQIKDLERKRVAWVLIFPICILSYFIIRGNVDIKPITIVDAYAGGSDTSLGNLKLNGLFTASKYIGKDEKSFTNYNFFDNETAMQIYDNFTNKPCVFPQDINMVDKPNIVLILVESMSAYFLDSFANQDFGITPNLDNLTKNSINFRNHYAINKRTITSLQAALTGIPPINGVPNLGFGLEAYLDPDIAKKFDSMGYTTIFLQSAKRRSYYIDAISSSIGYKHYYGMEDMLPRLNYPHKNGAYFGWDYELLMVASDKIKEFYKDTRKPFFVSMLTGTMHAPYPELPSQFMKFHRDKEGEDGYKNTLYYTDWSIGEFINSLKDEPFFNNTIFIITADHVSGRFEKDKYPNDFRIPLIIYRGGSTRSVDINNITTHLDISGSLLDIAGYDGKRDFFQKASLFCKDNSSLAILFHGPTIGIVTKDGYIDHSITAPIGFELEDGDNGRVDKITKFIQAYYQLSINRLLQGN